MALVCYRVVSAWLVVPVVVRDLAIMAMRVHALAHGRQLVTSRFAKWKTALQLVSVVFLLFVLAVQSVMERFHPGAVPWLGEGGLRVVGNGLMAAALLLTVMSGLQYLVGARFVRNGSSV
mgnify:FL=1